MNTKQNIKYAWLLLAFIFTAFSKLRAQQTESLDLQKAIDAALQNNHLFKIKSLKIEEKKAKVEEDGIKKYPSLNVNSLYQYNVNVGHLVIPQGSIGSLPVSPGTSVPLPEKSQSYELGVHNLFIAGISVYQPLTQQGKIKTGIDIDKTDVQIAENEKEKAAQQISQAVEKLYYGLLISHKEQEEAKANLELAKMKLYDLESALAAKKTIDANKAGLQANIADEEQNLLKAQIQEEDYLSELKHITGLKADRFQLEEVGIPVDTNNTLNQYQENAASKNTDIHMAKLTQAKSELAIKAAKQNNLPDIGLVAGYEYQSSFAIFPKSNPFAGLSLKWNLQDILSNKQLLKQRNLLQQQAQENMANTQEQINSDIEKAYRKLSQQRALILVAQKAANYRKEELKVQNDRQAAGLNTKTEILYAQSSLAKSEADLYSAQLGYVLALSDLRILTEGK